MKSISLGLLFVLVLMSCQTTASRPAVHPLQGDWELVSARFTYPDGRVSEFRAPQLRSIKIVGPARFSFITVREDGTFARAGAGTYTIQGNKYIEHVELSSAADGRGDYEFEWRVDGDLWYHKGSHNGGTYDEVWKRAR